MIITKTDGRNSDFAALCSELDDYLNAAAGNLCQRSHYDSLNKKDDINDVIIIYVNRIPVACGGFKQFDDSTAEIKRVFVKEEFRRQGFAKLVMKTLEEEAIKKGYGRLILETGNMLKEAISLYQSLGYQRAENYGPYRLLKQSVCMQKEIQAI